MEAHQLFATLSGAINGFNQHKQRLLPNGSLDLGRAHRDCASTPGHAQQIEAAAHQSRFGLIG